LRRLGQRLRAVGRAGGQRSSAPSAANSRQSIPMPELAPVTGSLAMVDSSRPSVNLALRQVPPAVPPVNRGTLPFRPFHSRPSPNHDCLAQDIERAAAVSAAMSAKRRSWSRRRHLRRRCAPDPQARAFAAYQLFQAAGGRSTISTGPIRGRCVAASGGGRGIAVAYAASRLGVRAHIFVPKLASRSKWPASKATALKRRSRATLCRGASACRRHQREAGAPVHP
jgi:hypothetical protein